jgi:hypothetical protein
MDRRPVRRSASYGRGSRETAPRKARALSERPISASSAAACTAVLTTSPRRDGAGGAAPLRGDGAPRGWAGWRRRGDLRSGAWAAGRGFAVLRVACGRLLREGLAAGRGVAARCCAGAGRSSAAGGWSAAGGAPVSDPPGSGAAGRAARLSLRRCGRLRGSPPSTSDGRSFAMRRNDRASCGQTIGPQPETHGAVMRSNDALFARTVSGCSATYLYSRPYV